MMTAKPTSPIDVIELVRGNCVTDTLHVAAELRIPDLLAAGPRSVEDLARETSTHAPSLRRLLRGLAVIGICEENVAGAWELTPAGQWLRSDVPGSLRDWVIFWSRFCAPAWKSLLDCVRTGKTAVKLRSGSETFDSVSADPKVAEIFNRGMVALTAHVSEAVITAYDFSRFRTIADVGGGYGALLAAILKANPSCRGILFDLPHAAEGARQHLEKAGVADRATVGTGSFFESIPSGADAYVFKSIIHDWDDDRSVAILRNCRRAIGRDGKLLLVERVMPSRTTDARQSSATVWSDLNMLVAAGGAERTEAEYAALLREAGFSLARVVPTGALFSIVEGVPV